jgi:hypothetical protein
MEPVRNKALIKPIFLLLIMWLQLSIGGATIMYLANLLPAFTPFLLVLLITLLLFSIVLTSTETPSKPLIGFVIILGFFALLTSVYYEITFLLSSRFILGFSFDFDNRISIMLKDFSLGRFFEMFDMFLWYIITCIGVIVLLQRKKVHKISNTRYMNLFQLLSLLIVTVAFTSYLIEFPWHATLLMILPIIIATQFYSSFPDNSKLTVAIFCTIFLPVFTLFLGNLIHFYIVRLSWNVQVALSWLFNSRNSIPFLFGTIGIILIGCIYVISTFKRNENEMF